ncbi:MAG: hypothetical protein DDT37_01107 [Firmicutes bacterium]|nr:hypothetical protein [candidate division NPL-UPA2 bacterium]
MLRLIGFLLVVTVLAVTAGCVVRSTGRVHDSNTVSIKDLEVGDRVAGLLVAEMYLEQQAWSALHFSVTFSGRLTLSGDYHFFMSNYDDSPVVNFVLDAASRQKVPHIAEDSRGETSYFHLAPHAAFGPIGSQGTATVVIDQLKLPHRERGEANSARLVRLVQKR